MQEAINSFSNPVCVIYHHMEIHYATLNNRSFPTEDTVVVIDVWRSFTTAAYVFNKGVREIIIAKSVEDTVKLRNEFSNSILIGMSNSVVGPPTRVTFLTTEPGLEDQACGEYMAGLLQGKAPNLSSMLSDIRILGDERTRELVCKGTISKLQGENIMNELEYCLAVDKFNFAMVVHRKNGLLKLKPVF